MSDTNHVVFNTGDSKATPVAPATPTPLPAPVLPEQPVVGAINPDKLQKTLRLMAKVAIGASKMTTNIEFDNKIAESFAGLVEEQWFVEMVAAVIDQFGGGKVFTQNQWKVFSSQFVPGAKK